MSRARARALANLALVKYFGKRDVALNLPAAGSLSIALEPLSTATEVNFDPTLKADLVLLDGAPAEIEFAAKVTRFLDLVRDRAGIDLKASVSTRNDFPTAAGLASSASGFAALALAAATAAGLKLDQNELSALARRGSGSAARSIPGGIAVWDEGRMNDGSDSFARSIAQPGEWDLRVVVGVTDKSRKPIGSTEAMELTRKSSPYYDRWIETARRDLDDAVRAVNARDLEALGEIAERSALSMHAAALAARPGIVMWNGATVEALHMLRSLRRQGTAVYFTCDAGPQPKALCSSRDEEIAAKAMSESTGIVEVIRCRIGGKAELVGST